MSDSNVIALETRRKASQRQGHSEKEREYEDLLEAADAFLDANPMWAVLRLGCFFKRKLDGTAMPFRVDDLKRHHPEWNEKFAKAVTMRMEERGWTYNDVTYSFNEVPADTLNLMDKSNWLKPQVGNYHWIFELLCYSIAGGKEENLDHLKHCIAYKYQHPEAFTIPSLVIHGEGSAGKNLMVNEVLRRMFGGATLSAASENITGEFNPMLAGMIVAMIDESMAEKTCGSKLKLICGNKFIAINTKNIRQYIAENTAWYWIGSNEKENGGVWLDRSHADRRYSVFHIPDGLTLEYWVALSQDWIGAEYTDEEYVAATTKAALWIKTEGIRHLTNDDEIRAWLGQVLADYGDREHPLALHGADYERLLGVQQRIYERIAKAVFTTTDENGKATFTHIRKKTLYEGYTICAKLAGERGILGDKVFYQKVNDWLRTHRMTHIVEDRVRQDTGRNAIWFDNRRGGHHRTIDNSAKYLDGRSRSWIGPEV